MSSVNAAFTKPPPSPDALNSVSRGLDTLQADRRRRARSFVMRTSGPGYSDHIPMVWWPVSGGEKRVGSFSKFLSEVDCNRLEVEVDLAVAPGPYRKIEVNGFVLERLIYGSPTRAW